MVEDQGQAKSWVSFMALVIVWFFWKPFLSFFLFFFLDNIEKGTHTLKGFEDFGIKSETAIAGKKCFESVFLKIVTNYVNMASYSVIQHAVYPKNSFSILNFYIKLMR